MPQESNRTCPMSSTVYIYGAGGRGRVLASIARSTTKFSKICFIDDNPKSPMLNGLEVVHASEVEFDHESQLIFGVGHNVSRYSLSKKIQTRFVTLVHSSASVCEFAKLGVGCAVMANAVLNTDSITGDHCIINSGAIVEHDCRLADFVHLSPNAALSGGVVVGEGTHIGLGACVIQGVKIGKWATIGAGAVIIKDVPDFAVVVGNPGKTIKFNTVNI